MGHRALAPSAGNEGSSSVNVANAVASSFSLLGSMFIVLSYFNLHKLRGKPAFKLVVLMSFGDIIGSAANLLPGGAPSESAEWPCQLQAWLTSWGNLSSVMWTASIAHTLYITVSLRRDASYVVAMMPRSRVTE